MILHPPRPHTPVDARPFTCPFAPLHLCESRPFPSANALVTHVNRVHLTSTTNLRRVPEAWLQDLELWVCKPCCRVNSGRRGCKGAKCANMSPEERRAQATIALTTAGRHVTTADPAPVERDPWGISLDRPRPVGCPSISECLANGRPILRHVPRGARGVVAVALARTLRQLVEGPSWATLIRYLCFSKHILAAPSHGGRKAANHICRGIVDRAVTWLCTPVAEI